MGASTSLLPDVVGAAAVNEVIGEVNLEHVLATSLQEDDLEETAACNRRRSSVTNEVGQSNLQTSMPHRRESRMMMRGLRSTGASLIPTSSMKRDDFGVDHLFKIRESWTSSAVVSGPKQRSRRDSRDDSTTMYGEGISGFGSSRSLATTSSSYENGVHRETLVKNLIVKTLVNNNNSSIRQLDGEKIYRKIVEGVVAEGETRGGGNSHDYLSSSSSSSTNDNDYLTNKGEAGGRSSGRMQITPSRGRRNGADLMPPKGECKRDNPPNIMFHRRQLQQRRQHRRQHPQHTSNNRKIDTVTNSFDEWSILSRRAQHYKQLLLDSNKASLLVQSQPSTHLSPSESVVQDCIQGVLLRQQQHESMQMRHRHAPSSPIPSPTTHDDTHPSAPNDPPSDNDSIVELQNSHHSWSTSAVSTSSLRPHSNIGEIQANISHILSKQSRDRRRQYKEMLLKQRTA